MMQEVPPELRPSLRAEQVAQTRAALTAAGRSLFGARGFSATSVEDLARDARVTTGALYHHFSTKAELFEAVFEQLHTELMMACARASEGASDEVDLLIRGFEAFLQAVMDPEVQRILILDGPAVLGLTRFTELDERYAFDVIVEALRAATASGRLEVDDPPTTTRLLLGALTRGAMLIANSPKPAETRRHVAHGVRALLTGLGGGQR